MIKTLRLSLVTLLLFLASLLNAVAAPPTTGVATVVAIRGTVVAQNAKEPARPLTLKSQIFQNDEIKTGATSATFSGTPNGGNSFSTALSGTGTGGVLKGAFFGPYAEAVGGNFYSSGASLKYIGIFGGNR